MQKRKLISKIAREARAQGATWEFVRAGGNHDIYRLNGLTIPIGNHRELGEGLARQICRECEPVLGKGWWR